MDKMLQMQDEVMKLTEQLFIAENSAKEANEKCKKKCKELWSWQEKARQLLKEKNDLIQDSDQQMLGIQNNLMLFEASLRSEQRKIGQLLEEKNNVIERQKKEILMYRTLILSKAKSEKQSQPKNSSCNSTKISKFNGKTLLSSVKEVDFNNADEEPLNDELCINQMKGTNGEYFDSRKDVSKETSDVGKTCRIIAKHRSVVKPKDVKNKRINKERSRSIDIVDSDHKSQSVTYWMHPYV